MCNDKVMSGKNEYPVIKQQESKTIEERVLQSAESPDSIKKFISTEGKLISVPIFPIKDKKEEVYCVLQVTDPLLRNLDDGGNRKQKIKKKRLFTARDEKTAIFLSSLLALVLDLHYLNEKLQAQKDLYQHFIDTMREMSGNRNLQEFLFTMKAKAPRLLGFDHIGILFQNKTEQVFYTYDMSKTVEDKFYSTYPVKYAMKMGLSNYLFQNDVELITANDPRQQKSFQPEIDNVAGAPAVRNIILALMRDDADQKVGVLQVVNKSDGKPIRDVDEQNVKKLIKLFASMTSHVSRIDETLNVTYALKMSMRKLETSESSNS